MGFEKCQGCKYCPSCTISPLTCDIEWITLSNKELEEHDKAIRQEANARIEALIREIHDLVWEQAYQQGRAEGIDGCIDIVTDHNALILPLGYERIVNDMEQLKEAEE